MNKKIIVGMVIIMALSTTACAKGSGGNAGDGATSGSGAYKDNLEKKDNAGKKENTGKNNGVEVKGEKQYVYGKVKSITGNEVELVLAKDPGVSIAGIDKDEATDDGKDNGGSTAATTGAASGSGQSDKVSLGEIEKNKPLIDLEFTEEQKNILIPIGVGINILSERKGEGLSAIKEGTYLRILVDDNKVENPNILAIDVIS
ncbi:MAG: hypothetical protein RR636_11255 [Clostridium sp.]|uniref:hypothetical protein n=1 Tax=Clostridium sp. TaxID=1506 RepID=UPI00305F2F46